MAFNIYEHSFFISLRHPFNKEKRHQLRSKFREKEHKNFLEEFHKQAPKVLKKFIDTVNKYDASIKIWIEFGTLLGAYRDNGLIAHDSDIDFGINEEDVSLALLSSLEQNGFRLLKKFTIDSNHETYNGFEAEYTFRYGDFVAIDLFVFKSENDKKICFSFDREEGISYGDTLRKYKNKLRTIKISLSDFELTKYSFLSFNVYIPKDTKTHLAEIYGKDFMTPRIYNYDNRIKDYEELLDNKTLGYIQEYK